MKPAYIVFMTKFQQSIFIILSINCLNLKQQLVVAFFIINNTTIAGNVATSKVPNKHIPYIKPFCSRFNELYFSNIQLKISDFGKASIAYIL